MSIKNIIPKINWSGKRDKIKLCYWTLTLNDNEKIYTPMVCEPEGWWYH